MSKRKTAEQIVRETVHGKTPRRPRRKTAEDAIFEALKAEHEKNGEAHLASALAKLAARRGA